MVHFIDMWYTVYTLYQEWWFSIAMFKYWRAFFCSKQHLWGLSVSDCQALTAWLKAWWFWPKVPPLDFRRWTISLSKQILGVHWVHGFGGTNSRKPGGFEHQKSSNLGISRGLFPPKKPRISEWIGLAKLGNRPSHLHHFLSHRILPKVQSFCRGGGPCRDEGTELETVGKSSIALDDFPRNCRFLGIFFSSSPMEPMFPKVLRDTPESSMDDHDLV